MDAEIRPGIRQPSSSSFVCGRNKWHLDEVVITIGRTKQWLWRAATGRRGYGIEIDSLYVDTAITRWEKMTGKQARHASGRTFADIKAERRLTP